MKPHRRKGQTPLASWALLAFPITSVSAVALNSCSNQNTGTDESTYQFQSNGNCETTCANQGYALAITQDSNCWCSDFAPGSTVDTSECNSPCPGYPYEFCGNSKAGLYGYINIAGKYPQGTIGASSSGGFGGFGGSTTAAPPPSTATTVMPTTVVSTPPAETETVVNSVSTPTVYITPSVSVVTSEVIQTVSGQAKTQFVTLPTSTATPAPSDVALPQPTHSSGISGGAAAGIAVGAIVGAGALVGLAFFLFWQRRRRNGPNGQGNGSNAGGGGMTRNSSVLSKVGLLRSQSHREDLGAMAASAPATATMGSSSSRPTLPQINTSGIVAAPGLDSAVSSEMSEYFGGRRNSRPLFVDNRLNPNATIMPQGNTSRTSISTLQDNQDYSRPLEVRNPDH